MTREATNKLLEAIGDGMIDRDAVIDSCLSYMSEADVSDMCDCEGYSELWEDGDDDSLTCPECDSEIWDMPYGSKLAKCWNAEEHASGGTLAFDTSD